MKSKHSKKSPDRRFASEEATDSLLAEILDSTEEDARREQAELEQSLATRRATEADERARARTELLAERSRKLEVELERQRQLAENRTRKMDALRAEETPAPPPTETPADSAAPDEDLPRPFESRPRDEAPLPLAPAPHVAPAGTITARHASFAAVAAVSLLAIGAAVVGFSSSNTYNPDRNLYAKAVFAPTDHAVVAVEVPSLLIPAAAAPKAAPEQESRPALRKAPQAAPRKVVRSKFDGIEAADPFSLD